MKKLFLHSVISMLAFLSACSKKCITCTKASQRCIECSIQGNTQTICEDALQGGLTLEQIQAGITLAGGTCQSKHSNTVKEETFCWNNQASENSAKLARITLEDKGYTCLEK
jgi:hypothetical protein